MSAEDSDDISSEGLHEIFRQVRQWIETAKQERINESLIRWDRELDEPSPGFLQQPDTCHPAHENQAEVARSFIERGFRDFFLAKKRMSFSIFTSDMLFPEDTPLETELFHVQRAYGPAPYVGKPFVYTWNVAVDRAKRWIAGPTQIRHLDGIDD